MTYPIRTVHAPMGRVTHVAQVHGSQAKTACGIRINGYSEADGPRVTCKRCNSRNR